jgi:hypothetical protein
MRATALNISTIGLPDYQSSAFLLKLLKMVLEIPDLACIGNNTLYLTGKVIFVKSLMPFYPYSLKFIPCVSVLLGESVCPLSLILLRYLTIDWTTIS